MCRCFKYASAGFGYIKSMLNLRGFILLLLFNKELKEFEAQFSALPYKYALMNTLVRSRYMGYWVWAESWWLNIAVKFVFCVLIDREGKWRRMKMYEGVWRWIKAYEGVWMLINMFGGVWRCIHASVGRCSMNVCGGVWRWLKANEGVWRWMKVYESAWRWMKVRKGAWRCMMVNESAWRCMKVNEGVWTCMNMYERAWKSMKVYESQRGGRWMKVY